MFYKYLLVLIHPFSIGSNETFFRHLFQKHRLCFRIRSVINQPKQEQTKPPAHSDSSPAMIVLLALRTGRQNSDAPQYHELGRLNLILNQFGLEMIKDLTRLVQKGRMNVGRWFFSCLKPLSVTNNSVGSRTAAASQVGHNSSARVASSGHSRTNALSCK